MILVWVISLILLISSLVTHLVQLNVLRIVQKKTVALAQKNFVDAEKSILECEKNITALHHLEGRDCFIQSKGKNYWLISSKEKPVIQTTVFIDEKTGITKRINWRQVFE